MQAPQPFHQLPMLSPQHQQQLMLAQAQQNLASPSPNDDSRRLRMLLNNRNMSLSKDGLSNPVSEVVSNVGSPLPGGGPPFPRGDTDMLMKVLVLLYFIYVSLLYFLHYLFNCSIYKFPKVATSFMSLHLLRVFMCS